MNLSQSSFKTQKNGEDSILFTLTTKNKLSVSVCGWGASITSIKMPNKEGVIEEITLGFDTLEEYQNQRTYFGSTIGRFGNRIANGSFFIGDKEHTLIQNNGPNCLHGGEKGFDQQNWKGYVISEGEIQGVEFTRLSPHKEEGFPGNLLVKVRYTLNEEGELKISYKAESDQTTPVNLTNHTFFNLKGIKNGSILDHEAILDCPFYIPINDVQIPTGEIRSVKNTPMDFLTSHQFGERIKKVGGYDHCYIIKSGQGLRHFATIYDPSSGRQLEASTDQPGVQLYTGNFLDGSVSGHGIKFKEHGGFCLETQLYPDCVNQTHFPSPLLNKGETYSHNTIYKFSVK